MGEVNKFTALARGPQPAASLSEATWGVLDRSTRQREVRRPHGFADELRTALTGPGGTWGTLTLLRAAPSPHFTTTEVNFVASLAGILADGLRRATLVHDGVEHDGVEHDDHDGTGLLVLAADNTIEMSNHLAEDWLDQLGVSATLDDRLHLKSIFEKSGTGSCWRAGGPAVLRSLRATIDSSGSQHERRIVDVGVLHQQAGTPAPREERAAPAYLRIDPVTVVFTADRRALRRASRGDDRCRAWVG